MQQVQCAGLGGHHAWHETEGRYPSTLGLGMAAVLAEKTGLTVLSDFRARDLAAGGLGGIIGDAQLPNAGPEQILEAYYRVGLSSFAHFTADYQFIDHPAYNRDRGPVSIFGLRLHLQL